MSVGRMPSGATRVAAVIGDPVSHSLSPVIHNAAFGALDLDWVFLAFRVPKDRGAAAIDAMRVLGLSGMSVTMPHKADVIASVDEVSPDVEALGAANCIVHLGGGVLRAENTDGAGFVAGLRDDAGISPEGRTVAVLGAGGAARAVIRAVAEAGAAEIHVINRSVDRAAAAAHLAGSIGRVSPADSVSGADIVVNATPLGMGSDTTLPCEPGLLGAGQVAVDLIYEPARTRWFSALRDNDVEVHNGLSMLVRQAAAAFTLWTGEEAPLAEMRSSALENLPSR